MLKKLILGGLLTAALALAQGGMGGGGMGGGGGDMGGRGGDMGGGMPRSMPTPMERISTALTLNKDQKKEVRSIMDDAQKEALPVRDQLAKGRQTIAQAVAAGKSQDELSATINEYAAAQAKMTQIEIGAFAKIYAALEKDQQAKSGMVLQMMSGIFLKGKNWDAAPAVMAQ